MRGLINAGWRSTESIRHMTTITTNNEAVANSTAKGAKGTVKNILHAICECCCRNVTIIDDPFRPIYKYSRTATERARPSQLLWHQSEFGLSARGKASNYDNNKFNKTSAIYQLGDQGRDAVVWDRLIFIMELRNSILIISNSVLVLMPNYWIDVIFGDDGP